MHGLLISGLLVLGAACGATLRLMVFAGVLLGGVVIAAAVIGAADGAGQAGLAALIAAVSLQVGYVSGFVLRAAIRSARDRSTSRARRQEGVAASLGERRRP